MTVLVRIVAGSAYYARHTVTEGDGYVCYSDGLGLLAQAGVKILLATSSDWPPEAVLAFGADGTVVDLTERSAS